MSIVVKFVGGPLDGRVEERPNARPVTFARLAPPAPISWAKSAEAASPRELGYNEFEYWLIPKRDGTWEAFERPVWDSIHAHLRDAEEEFGKVRQRARDALDKILLGA